MIGVTVGHEYADQTGTALVKMVIDLGEMPRFADAGIDERGVPVRSDEQICIVARPGHGAWVVSGQRDWLERHGEVWNQEEESVNDFTMLSNPA